MQQHTEGVAHDVGLELAKAFSTWAALKHKGLALSGLCQMVAQAAHLPCKNQRGVGAQPVFHHTKGRCIWISRNLLERKRTPAIRHPGLRRRVGLGERGTHNAFLFSWADYTQMVSRMINTISLGHGICQRREPLCLKYRDYANGVCGFWPCSGQWCGILSTLGQRIWFFVLLV